MEGEKIDVGSKYFETNVQNSFKQQWNEQDFADVTLVTSDDKQLKAHKIILSSSSQFFKNILLRNPHPNPLLYLKDINYEELYRILQFIYLGQCNVGTTEVVKFLSTGNALGVAGLMDEIIPNEKPENYVGKCVDDNQSGSEEDIVTNGFDQKQRSGMQESG